MQCYGRMSDTIDKYLAECKAREAARTPITFKEVCATAKARAIKAGVDDFNFEFTEAVQWSHGIVVLYRDRYDGHYHRTTIKNVVIVEADSKYMTPIKRK